MHPDSYSVFFFNYVILLILIVATELLIAYRSNLLLKYVKACVGSKVM